MKLQEFFHDDPNLEKYREKLHPFVGGYNARGVPYHVFVYEDELVGIVVVSEEPVRLIEPIGTLMSNIVVIDYTKPIDVLKEFADACLRIAIDQDVVYSFIDISEEYNPLIEHFQSIGFEVIAHSLRMSRNLANYEHHPCKLRAERITREDVLEFIEKLKECMSGSKDNMLNIVLDNIRNLPDQFIDHWYNSTNIYSLYDNESFVGILELSPHGLNIANIGVDPKQRGKGYGREIMKFSLNTLKEQGIDTARLRVHAENNRAIHLYESFGMTRGNTFKALIWRK